VLEAVREAVERRWTNERVPCNLRNASSGSGSPVSTWPEMSGSTSARQAKFSMNWLGSSTASHGTPLMPATLGKFTRVSMWCRPWPNSWNSVSTS
jgi:hypothetical protein